MNKIVIILSGCLIFNAVTGALATNKIVTCPALSAGHYGRPAYYDPRSGKTWQLTWLSKQTPIWKGASIPQTTTCGMGKSHQGLPVAYQCAIFQCKSDAVIASLGQNHNLKCFSAYVSTQNTFYCDSFTVS